MGRKGMFGKNKLTKEEKQLRKQYFKMIRKNRKELNSLNKAACTRPWDSSYGLDYFVAYMKFMQDYYNLGWNVWQTDDTLIPLKKSLNEALEAYEKWQGLEDEFFHDDTENKENFKKILQEYPERKKKFFDLLCEHIEEWWD